MSEDNESLIAEARFRSFESDVASEDWRTLSDPELFEALADALGEEITARDDLDTRLSELLWHLTNGRMSNTGYEVKTMVAVIEDIFDQEARSEIQIHASAHQDAAAERNRYRKAIEKALAFEAVLPAIATVPRRILEEALSDEPPRH